MDSFCFLSPVVVQHKNKNENRRMKDEVRGTQPSAVTRLDIALNSATQ